MNKFFKRPNGKENLSPRVWYDKWHAYLYGDALAKQGVKHTRVFLDDLEKIKKHSKIKKNIFRKADRTPMDVSTMNGDEKPNNDVSRDIHIGVQVGIPEKVHRFTFSYFRKQSREINYGSDSN